MALFLTDDELRELTGLKRPSAQSRWLFRNGIPHAMNAEGRPRVLRSHIEKILGDSESPPRADRRKEPDWSAI